jgi:uncharacterized ParB-like nuclease family protein
MASKRKRKEHAPRWTEAHQKSEINLQQLLFSGIRNDANVTDLRTLMKAYPRGGKFGVYHREAKEVIKILNAANDINDSWNLMIHSKRVLGMDDRADLEKLSDQMALILQRAATNNAIKNANGEGQYDYILAWNHEPDSMDYSQITSIQKLWGDMNKLDEVARPKGPYGDKPALQALGNAMTGTSQEANRTLAKTGMFSFGQEPVSLATAIAKQEALHHSHNGQTHTGYMDNRGEQGVFDDQQDLDDKDLDLPETPALSKKRKTNQGGRRKKRKSRKKKKTKRKRKTKGKRKTKRKKSKKRRKTRKKQ